MGKFLYIGKYFRGDIMLENLNFRNREGLIEEISQVESSLSAIYNNMQYAEDIEIVDYYTFKLKSEQAKHDFLMRKIKENLE